MKEINSGLIGANSALVERIEMKFAISGIVSDIESG